MKKGRIIFLASGNGGTLRFIHHCIDQNILPQYEIISIIADRECGAVHFAKNNGIKSYVVQYDENNRIDLLRKLESMEFEIAITTINKILDENIVSRFDGKLINVHPSFLPAFKGFNAIKNALDAHAKFLGTTVHLVNNEIDAGEILAQSVTPITYNLSLNGIMESQFRAWNLNLLNILLRRTDGRCVSTTDSYQKTVFNPPLCFDTICFTEGFWSRIKHDW
jgi:phosphoribosylglycinamide formyltransferase-1